MWHPAKRLRRKLILSGILPKFSDLGQGAIGEAIEAARAGQFGRLHKETLDDRDSRPFTSYTSNRWYGRLVVL